MNMRVERRFAWQPLARGAGIPGLLCAFIALSGLSGCIENPEPDPRLGTERPQTAMVAASFDGQREARLFIELVRDSGHIDLNIENPLRSRVDSATVLLWMMPRPGRGYSTGNLYFNALENPKFLYFGKIGAVPGEGFLSKRIEDTLKYFAFDDLDIRATLLDLTEDGVRHGFREGRVIRGSYQRADSVDGPDGPYLGPVLGTLNAAGRFRAGCFRNDETTARDELRGILELDGSLSSGIHLGFIMTGFAERPAQGRLSQDGREFQGDFLIHPPAPGLGDTTASAGKSAVSTLRMRIEFQIPR